MRRVGACRATGGDDAITWKPSVEATARIQVERSGFAGRTGSQTDTSPNAKPMWDVSQPKAGLPLAQSASSPSLAPIRPRPTDASQPPGGGDVREALRLQYAAILSIAEAVRARPPPAEALAPRRPNEDAVAMHLRSEVAHLRHTVSRQKGELAWQQAEIPSARLVTALTPAPRPHPHPNPCVFTRTCALAATLVRPISRSFARQWQVLVSSHRRHHRDRRRHRRRRHRRHRHNSHSRSRR